MRVDIFTVPSDGDFSCAEEDGEAPAGRAQHAQGDATLSPVAHAEPTPPAPVPEPPPAPEPEMNAPIEAAGPTPAMSGAPVRPAVSVDAEVPTGTGSGHRWFPCRNPNHAVVHIGGGPEPGFAQWISDAALWTFVVPSTGEAWGFTYYSDTWTPGPSGFGPPPFGQRVEPSSKRWHSVVGVRCRAPGPDTDNPRARCIAILFLNRDAEPLVVLPTSLDAGSARWVREATARMCGTAVELPGEPHWDASWQVLRSDLDPVSV